MPTVARECTGALSRTVCDLSCNESFGQPKTLKIGNHSSESTRDVSVTDPVQATFSGPDVVSKL
jgi:hypothetical protein